MWMSLPQLTIMKAIKSLAMCTMLGVAAFAIAGCKTENHSGATAATAGVKPYPLHKCVVSDEAIEAGKAYTFVRDGQEVKLCCKDCLAEFDKDPRKYMAKLDHGK
jgi:hypothetical protein